MWKELEKKCRKKGIIHILSLWSLAIAYLFILNAEFSFVTVIKRAMYDNSYKFLFIIGIMLPLIFFLVGLHTVINIATKKYMKEIYTFLAQHPEYTLKDIEGDYVKAARFNGETWFVGPQFMLFIKKKSVIGIIELNAILWSYSHTVSVNGVPSYYLAIHTRNKQYYEIECAAQEYSNSVLNYFITFLKLPIVAGYSKELHTLYNTDINEFMQKVPVS